MELKNATNHTQTRCASLKKPAAQIVHLVFANTQANPKKPKEQLLANTLLNRILTLISK